jgi:hypothetical protein
LGIEPLSIEPLGIEPLSIEPLSIEPLSIKAMIMSIKTRIFPMGIVSRKIFSFAN